MINIESSEFFLPTKRLRSLSVLLTIHHCPDIRQQQIAEKVGMSGAMVNSYIKHLKADGYLDVKKKNGRDLDYRLTDSGRMQVMIALMSFSAEIVQLHSKAKDELISRLQKVFHNGDLTKVVLYGGSETARLVVGALEEFPTVNIAAVLDTDARKWGDMIAGYVIQSPQILNQINPDKIIIASFARQKEIEGLLCDANISNDIIIRLSTL